MNSKYNMRDPWHWVFFFTGVGLLAIMTFLVINMLNHWDAVAKNTPEYHSTTSIMCMGAILMLMLMLTRKGRCK